MKKSIQEAIDFLSLCKPNLSSIAWRNRVICKATTIYIQSIPTYNKPRFAWDSLVAEHHGVSIGDKIGYIRKQPNVTIQAKIKKDIKILVKQCINDG